PAAESPDHTRDTFIRAAAISAVGVTIHQRARAGIIQRVCPPGHQPRPQIKRLLPCKWLWIEHDCPLRVRCLIAHCYTALQAFRGFLDTAPNRSAMACYGRPQHDRITL